MHNVISNQCWVGKLLARIVKQKVGNGRRSPARGRRSSVTLSWRGQGRARHSEEGARGGGGGAGRRGAEIHKANWQWPPWPGHVRARPRAFFTSLMLWAASGRFTTLSSFHDPLQAPLQAFSRREDVLCFLHCVDGVGHIIGERHDWEIDKVVPEWVLDKIADAQ